MLLRQINALGQDFDIEIKCNRKDVIAKVIGNISGMVSLNEKFAEDTTLQYQLM